MTNIVNAIQSNAIKAYAEIPLSRFLSPFPCRIHGVRIMIAEKNIGRRVYSINQLQAQFLPAVYRPPKEVLEDLMRKDDT
jgi:hypothetical protein